MHSMQLQDLQTSPPWRQERSFSVAARKLHRTQPAVSQAIRRIEDELGDRLFDRSSRNGALTAAGVLLLEHADAPAEDGVRSAEAAVRALQRRATRTRRDWRQRGGGPLAAAVRPRLTRRSTLTSPWKCAACRPGGSPASCSTARWTSAS